MTHRLRALSWGWIIIALAYGIGVLPFEWTAQLFWVGLATTGAYLVLMRRTVQTTRQMAQESSQPTVSLWKTAFSATLINPILLAVPIFSTTLAAQKLFNETYFCSILTSNYCYTTRSSLQWEQVVIAIGILATFLLLDHGLIIALTLLANKYMVKSPAVVSNLVVGGRVLMAGFIMGLIAVTMTGIQMANVHLSDWPTDYRVTETISSGFEPLTADGVFLAANVLNHASYCYQWDPQGSGACTATSDNRPFIARQMVSALLGILMYGVLIVGTLQLVSPFSLRLSLTGKPKRGFVEPEADIVSV